MAAEHGCKDCGQGIEQGTGLNVMFHGPHVKPSVDVQYCQSCGSKVLKKLNVEQTGEGGGKSGAPGSASASSSRRKLNQF